MRRPLQADQLYSYAALPDQQQPDEIWLCLPLSDEAGIRTSLDALRHSVANIRLVPDWFSLKLINHGISEALGIPMLDLSASPVTGTTRLLKAAEDRLLALLILVLISPIMVVIAVAVKFSSPGPIYFKQKRNGWNGNVINVYKFRSMYMHQEDDGQVTQATQGDPRITPLGRFLRRTSLDELPQFINVLQGRMSIVGPRPHAVAHNDYYKQHVPRYMLRHKVKPGITGWAQVHGLRGETDTLEKMEKRVEYDLYYIEHMSLWLDLKIMAMTVFKGFTNSNAY
jgi:putative colanic acid biosynthesis UDP-glucose lipid carrier transferase